MGTALIVAAVVAAGLGSTGRARAQVVDWTHTRIAEVGGGMPSIVVDRLGYVHVGWTLDTGGSSYWAYHVGNQSGGYALTLVDSRSTGSPQPIFPFISADSQGYFHLAWRELGLTGSPIFYRTNNPETRALVKKSFTSSGHTHDPVIDVTADDVAHIITEADSCSGCSGGSNLYDESFAATTAFAGRVFTLTQDANDATGVQQFASTVTPDNTRHLVFSMRLAPPADNQRLVYYSARVPGSLTWSTPVSITGHQSSYQGWPAVVADGAGTLHVVYASEDYGIYYLNKPDGGVWSAPVRINDQNAVMDTLPSIAIDPNGRLHVAFQRFTPVSGNGTVVSLHYTTNAFDPDNWLDPASQVLTNVSVNGTQLTHQNRKLAVNWVDGQVLIPYQLGNATWLASTGDVPVTPPDPGGTSTLAMHAGFTPPTQISRLGSNTAASATSVLQFDVVDAGGDGAATRIDQIHVNTDGYQTFPRAAGKDEGLSYLLGGARLVTGSGDVVTGVLSEKKIVFRDSGHRLWVANGATQTYDLQIWMKNQTYVTANVIGLRVKPDQDIVIVAAGSPMTTDQPVVGTGGVLVVDGTAVCAAGASCNDGDPCTFNDTCGGTGVCAGTPITCASDVCAARACNGTAACSVTPHPGFSCDDGNACTHGDVCGSAGACGGTAITCASDTCNTRVCNGSPACTVTPRTGTTCDDGNACTHSDVCGTTGTCAGSVIACVSDGCNVRVCNGSPACTVIAKTGASCDDGNACTHTDVCGATGACGGTAVTCANDACNVRACNGSAACTVTPVPGALCDDGNACTHSDVCGATGACGGTAVTCVSDACTTRACNGTVACVVSPKTGTTCDDGNACTHTDRCTSAGQCAGMAIACADDACTSRACNGTTSCTVTAKAGAGATCAQVDECASGAHNCGAHATCTNTPGSFTCACQAGYAGDGVTCVATNPCLADATLCDPDATCAATPTGHTCTCNPGYQADGAACKPAKTGGGGGCGCAVGAGAGTPGTPAALLSMLGLALLAVTRRRQRRGR